MAVDGEAAAAADLVEELVGRITLEEDNLGGGARVLAWLWRVDMGGVDAAGRAQLVNSA